MSVLEKIRALSFPPDYLSLEYISNCKDLKELEKILITLRDDEGGLYSHLLACVEERISHLNPNNLLLKYGSGVVPLSDLDKEHLDPLMEEMSAWQKQMHSLEQTITTAEREAKLVPPVRDGGLLETGKKSVSNVKEKKEDWSEFSTEKELRLEVDKERRRNAALLLQKKTTGSSFFTNSTPMGSLAKEEREILALREKQKGNECFKSEDYKEAIRFYSNSIAINPSVEAFNNRALAFMKGENYLLCLKDCGAVLSEDPNNIKALLRCGSSHSKLNNRLLALEAFRKVLEIEPDNKLALKEVQKLEIKLIVPEAKNTSRSGKSPLIEEI
ncbi:sperm-associated antigen 1 [Neocloeon triangulifer]|uniref:sperm-associated antigen 1 n=1 Tax=Neocloeon triangulifer TaxID=2078957 RepID=UPI00286F0B01|nr:sperm-associated antigen 1 [Neocloeon triangulifer]